RVFVRYGRLKRIASGVDGRVVRRYMAGGGERRLHIGCGVNAREGWLNTDWYPRSGEVLHLDVVSVRGALQRPGLVGRLFLVFDQVTVAVNRFVKE
ncbi:MAG: hypothetical protein ABFS02_01950, partial [Pseudomonadota bacterium]